MFATDNHAALLLTVQAGFKSIRNYLASYFTECCIPGLKNSWSFIFYTLAVVEKETFFNADNLSLLPSSS